MVARKTKHRLSSDPVFDFLFFFLRFYLFIHERERERQRHRQREKLAPRREPVGLDPRTPGSHTGQKAGLQLLSHRGVPNLHFLKDLTKEHMYVPKNLDEMGHFLKRFF